MPLPKHPGVALPPKQNDASSAADEAAPRPPAIDNSFAPQDVLVESRGVSVFYGKHEAIKSASLRMARNNIIAMIGPSGCGKSTFLRSINRLNDLIPGCSVKGELFIDGHNIYDASVDLVSLRRQVGLVFQKPNPFPKSIYDNIAYGPRLQGISGRRQLDQLVEDCLRRAALWEEVKDRLHSSALGLSGGQQQRLCIGRALATKPAVLLMDEPCSALDPIATTKVEDLITDLKSAYTIVIVTHNMQQAARVSDYTAFFYMGELVEYNKTATLFTNPSQKKTEDYVTGRFG
ncbi:MAG TPA: phosphate ABC transporter ATP-binding protein PstB [Tepidisphaeraceae bacterium]|nr:phosphate ABC transporter ATP-binding protein PstB [Tepidisphaeraceae bacterium]